MGGAMAQPVVVVTGVREPLTLERLTADVVVIDADAIRASSADSLADLLRREAGLQLARNGGPGQNSGVFMRGASPGLTLVLIDGVRVGSATLGSTGFESLSLSQIERVEVLRGPGSSLYGADAIGGVVQVFTRRGEGPATFSARAAVGGFGSREGSAGVQGGTGAWDYAATLSREQSEGVSSLLPGADSAFYAPYNPDRDGFSLNTAQARLGFRPAPGHRVGLAVLRTQLDSEYDGVDYPAPTFAPTNTSDFRTKLDTAVTTLDWRGTLSESLTGSVRATRSLDDSLSGGVSTDRFRTTRELLGLQLAWRAGAVGQLTGALERTDERAASTSYGADVARRGHAFVLALAGDAGAWSWQADLRRDDSSDYGTVDTGRVGGSVALAPGLRLRALAGTTFKAPSFNDLYFPGYGVASVQPERGRSVEVGLAWRNATSEAAATVYRNRVRELIGYQPDRSFCPPDPAYDFGCAANVNRATLEGATLAGAHRLGAWRLKAQLDFLEARDGATGSRLVRRAAHQGSLGADWTSGDWDAGASVLRVGERPDFGKRLAAETTLDLTAGWRFAKGWSLQARLLNATDETVEPAANYQGLGRQAWLALRYERGL